MPPLAGVPSSVSQALKLWAQQVLAQIQAAGGATGVNAIPQQYALVAGSALPPIASVSNCTVALDTTQQLFGAGSYKVSLTGSPAVLTLASNTAWPMQPGWQWLVSFFQQATAAIAGEVTVTTSAGKAYSATFTTTLDSAGWDRLYDALNLVADTSAAFGLSFTFTGGAGQTVWLDGLMLSPFYGRPSVLPSFQSGSAPLLLDNNPDGFYSKILSSRTAGNVAFNFRGAWSSTANYLTGDEVVYGPTYWVALADSINVQPATGVSAWQAVGSYSEFVGAWSSTSTYAVGAEVTYSGSYWVAVVQNSNSAPTTTNANWQIAGSTSAANITYTDGTTVQSLQPAEAGADVTATHTSNDTSNVNGVAASSISPIANLMPAEAGADVTATHTSALTASLSNQTLTNLADGTSRFAVTNAAGMAGVSYVDANNNPRVDFTQSYHIGKTLTNIPDGTSRFAVVNAGSLGGVSYWDTNNNPRIDFTQSYHIGKILDNVPDGTSRFAVKNGSMYGVSYIDPNSRALIDFSQSGHLNKTADYIPAGTSYGISPLHVGAEGLVQNGDFVNGFAGWSAPAGAEIQTGSGPFTNARYAAFTSPQYKGMVSTRSYASNAGDVYYVSGWAWQSAAGAATLGILCYDGAGNYLSANYVSLGGATGAWGRISGTLTAPSNCAYFTVFAGQQASGTNEVMYTGVNLYKIRSLDTEVSDGTIYGRFKNSYFDSLSTRRVATINGAMAPQGSVASGASSVVFSYSSTDSSVTPAWTAGTLYRMDGTTTAVGSGSQAVTGLSASTTYYSAAYYDETSGAVSFVTGASGAVGTPAICYTSQTAAVAAVASQQANLNFGWLSMTTAASGGTGGGGTGGACCVAGRQRVRMGDGSWKFAEDIEAGDTLPCPGGVTTVRAPGVVPWRDWRRVAFENGVELIVAEGHRFVDPAGAQRYAVDLRVNDVIQTDSGYTRVVAIALDEHLAQRVSVEVNAPHLYYLNGVLCHNKYVCQ